MPSIRSYDDPCGVARALDVVGDRWALLVIRELSYGPKRFLALRTGLGTISPNVLSQRLRDLENAGLVTHETLDLPAAVAIYALTDRGRALKPILIELGRWGSREPRRSSGELSVNAFLLALETVFDPARALDATFALSINGEWFVVTTAIASDQAPASIEIMAGRTDRAAATLRADIATMRAVAFSRETVASASRAGRLHIDGDPKVARQFSQMFAVPAT